jgi:chromosome segregation ATPase
VNLLEETQNRRVQLQDLLDRAEDQQQTLDAQLADMDGHRAKAINAVEDGNSVLQDATRTLETLNGKSRQTHILSNIFFKHFLSPQNKLSVVNKTILGRSLS